MILTSNHFERPLILDRTAQCSVQETKRLHRLAKIVTCRSQERTIGFVGAFGLRPRIDDVLLHELAFGDVANHGRNEGAACRCDWAQTYFHGKFAAIPALANQVEARAHRTHGGIFRECLAMADVAVVKTIRQQGFHELAQQFLTIVSKHAFSLFVDDRDLAIFVGDNHRVGCGLKQCPEISL